MMPARREGKPRRDSALHPVRNRPNFNEALLAQKLRGASGRDREVFEEFASWANFEDGLSCYPSRERIAAALGMDPSHVTRALRRLESRGVIVKAEKEVPGRYASWSFAPVMRPPPDPSSGKPARPAGGSGARPAAGRGIEGRSVRCRVCNDRGETPVGTANGRILMGPCSCTTRRRS